MKTIVNAAFVATLALGAGHALADGSSFPYYPDENGGSQRYTGSTWADSHPGITARSDGSSFPRHIDENGGNMPYVAGSSFADRHHAELARGNGSSFPWTVDENGGGMVRALPAPRIASVPVERTANADK